MLLLNVMHFLYNYYKYIHLINYQFIYFLKYYFQFALDLLQFYFNYFNFTNLITYIYQNFFNYANYFYYILRMKNKLILIFNFNFYISFQSKIFLNFFFPKIVHLLMGYLNTGRSSLKKKYY